MTSFSFSCNAVLTVCQLVALCQLVASASLPPSPFIAIRGQTVLQNLPITLTKSWETWTFRLDDHSFTKVEHPKDDAGDWVDPTSFNKLYLPLDLPLPLCQPALGIAVSNGIPRYIMPSVVLSLETPERIWRNRGICSLPRSRCWIDLFSPFTPSLDRLKLSYFGRSAPEVRFLEDQDGSAAWTSLLPYTMDDKYRLFGYKELFIKEAFESFQTLLDSSHKCEFLRDGYHFVDVVLGDALAISLPKYRMKAFLTDLDDPKRLVGIEDTSMLDAESCGELDIAVSVISAGGTSEFLPSVYRDLYEEGNIIIMN